GGDHLLVDAPGGLDLDVLVEVEQCGELVFLAVGEQVDAGVQRPPCAVERVVLRATAPVDDLLHPASAPVQGVTGQADDVEGVHHRDRVGQFLGGGGLEAGEAVHRDHLHRVAPRVGTFGKPGLERLLGAALDHVEQTGRAGALDDAGQVDDHGDVLVATAGVAPHVL